MLAIDEAVGSKLDSEAKRAAEIGEKAVSNARLEKIEPRIFFADRTRHCIKRWSNLPKAPAGLRYRTANMKNQVDIASHLLMEDVPIIDLEPFSERDFELNYGMRVRDVEDLAEQSAILVNLYVRDPSKWRGFQHLSRLVELSFGMGPRAEAYFRCINPRFDGAVRDHASNLEKLFSETTRLAPAEINTIASAARIERERLPRYFATWLAYLESIDPTLCEPVLTLFSDHHAVDAFNLLRVRKHRFASPISAAAAGRFHLSVGDRGILESHPRGADTTGNSIVLADRTRNAIKSFLVNKLVSLPTLDLDIYRFTDEEFRRLRKLLFGAEFIDVQARVQRAMDALVTALEDGDLPSTAISDLEKYFKAQTEMIVSHKLGHAKGAIGAGGAAAGGLIEYSLGGLMGGVAGAAMGGVLAWWIGNKVEAIPVGEAFYRHFRPDRYKLYEIKKIAATLNEN